jgi:hypothetical protein
MNSNMIAKAVVACALLALNAASHAALTFYVAIEDLTASFVAGPGVTPGISADGYTSFFGRTWNSALFDVPPALFFENSRPAFAPYRRTFGDDVISGEVSLTSQGVLNHTTFAISGQVNGSYSNNYADRQAANFGGLILQYDPFANLRVTPDTDVYLSGRVVVRASSTVGGRLIPIPDRDEVEAVGVNIFLYTGAGAGWEYIFNDSIGYNVTYQYDDFGGQIFSSAVYSPESINYSYSFQDILMRRSGDLPYLGIEMQVELYSDLTVTSVVPEPSQVWMLCAGLLLFTLRRQRVKQSKG